MQISSDFPLTATVTHKKILQKTPKVSVEAHLLIFEKTFGHFKSVIFLNYLSSKFQIISPFSM